MYKSTIKKLGVLFVMVGMIMVISAFGLLPGDAGEMVVEADSHSNNKTVVILHTNDEHGVLENFGKIAWMKEQLKEEHDDVFLVSAGDAFSGNPIVDEYVIDDENLRGKPMIDTMGAAGYQAMTIGNHEFDYGQERLQESIDSAEFPIMLANVEIDPDEADMEQPEPYTILETNFGAEIAFLSVLQVSGEYPSTLPLNLYGLDFLDPVETALEYTHLREEADVFVGLSHLGHDWDHDFAEAMGELDVIIGGHSHTAVADPVFVNDVLITQTGGDAEQLGKITLTLNEDNEIVEKDSELIEVEDIEGTDEEVEEVIAGFEAEIEDIFAREINHLDEPISGKEDLGSFMTDAVVESDELADLDYDVDIAFQNSGGIRVDQLEAGPLTVGDIFELEPFGNDLIIYQMTPDDIRSLIANDFESRGEIDLRVSGIKYEVEVGSGNSVETVNLYDMDGNELPEDEVYTVALNSYIASTADFTAQDDGENSYLRHNDTIINFVENIISEEELNERYQDLDRTSSEIVGEGEKLGETEVEISAADNMVGSNSAGNLMTDAIRSVTGADIATFPSYSGLSEGADPIEAGEEINDLNLPSLYGNYIDENQAVVGEISGADLEEFLLERGSAYDNVDLQISGMNYTLITDDDDKVVDIETNLDPDKTYTVTFNSYEYGDSYQPIEGFERDYTTDKSEQEMLIEYIEEQGAIGDEVAEERIKIE
ncbi:MAG: 5'-nucleotidase C-terminal domain-containing protein [Bacillota bacterium]